MDENYLKNEDELLYVCIGIQLVVEKQNSPEAIRLSSNYGS
jgi:hypothetical protein